MRRGWLGAILLSCVALCAAFQAEARGPGAERITVQGRAVDVYTPPGLSGPAPMLIVLHGGLGNARQMARRLPMMEEAARGKFRVAYPDGSTHETWIPGDRRVWNAGSCCGTAVAEQADDSGHLVAVIHRLIAEGLVRRGDIHLAGHSNGAMMAYRFACEHDGMAQSIVAISGALVVPDCPGLNGLRVLIIHGEDDDRVPVAGGGRPGIGPFPPLERTLSRLRSAGADVQVMMVPGGGHSLSDLDTRIGQATGRGLPATVADFSLR